MKYIIWIKNNKLSWILFILILNAVADNTTKYFPPKTLNPGSVRMVMILVTIFLLMRYKNVLYSIPAYLRIAILYFLFIGLFSSNYITTLIGSIILITPWLLYHLSFTLTTSIHDLKRLIKALFFSTIVTIISLTVAQLYGVGESAYVEDTFYTGGADTEITIVLAFFVLISVFLLENIKMSKKNKILFLITTIAALTFVVVNMRRGPIFGLIIGLFTYYMLTYQLFTAKFIKTVIILIIGGSVIYFFMFDTFEKRLEYRTRDKNKLENEGRYKETQMILGQLSELNVKRLFFGDEFLNSYSNLGRSLHVDYNQIIHGGGLIGLIIYLNIFFQSYLRLRRMSSFNTLNIDKSSLLKTKRFKILLISLIIMYLVVGFSKIMIVFGASSMFFIFLGSGTKLLFLSKYKNTIIDFKYEK